MVPLVTPAIPVIARSEAFGTGDLTSEMYVLYNNTVARPLAMTYQRESSAMPILPRSTTKLALLALATLGLSSAANADFLWYQFPWTAEGASPSIDTDIRRMKTADDFTLAVGNGQAYQISRIAGVVVSALPSALNNYRVEVYADGLNKPGSLIHSSLATNNNDFGQAQGNGSMRVFQLWFDMNLTLAAGHKYWVSITGVGGITPQVLWAGTSPNAPISGSAALFADSAYGSAWNPSTSWGSQGRDAAFTVQGMQIVPTASTAMLTALGLTATARRRRK